jgi:hypothetical protein
MTTGEKLQIAGIAVAVIIAIGNAVLSRHNKKTFRKASESANPAPRKKGPVLTPFEKRSLKVFRRLQIGEGLQVVFTILLIYSGQNFPFNLPATPWDKWLWLLPLSLAISGTYEVISIERNFIRRIKNYDSAFLLEWINEHKRSPPK